MDKRYIFIGDRDMASREELLVHVELMEENYKRIFDIMLGLYQKLGHFTFEHTEKDTEEEKLMIELLDITSDACAENFDPYDDPTNWDTLHT